MIPPTATENPGQAQPHCDQSSSCGAPPTMLDQSGYIYCESHGLQRRQSQPCRRLRPNELAKIQRGEPIRKY